MAYLLVLSEEAVEDIDEIFGFGEHKFGKAQALHYLLGLEQHFKKLKFNPFIGRERNEIKVGLYSLPYVSHTFFSAS
ncbi:type II toxin-antitoxin system RelE/ParE family toxin [Flagellimonas baculiformis]|uniref:type II toxin-antitoxin system RelE/ParE family toxin n=1 Tax=Flagellimonas baculiformis TaxID=3067310 RepID=UPI002970008D|nr:type II toxin-antitoxin system RelE/ParE family toxin [Muricauda sp. D6]